MSEHIISSLDAAKIKESDVYYKLMCLGTLFTNGWLEESLELADQLYFDDIMLEDRTLLVLIIFSKLFEHELIDDRNADALKHILMAICPEALLAHARQLETFAQGPPIEFDYSRTINQSVRGTVFFNEFRFGDGSRKNEAGYRIQKALSSKEWDVSLLSNAAIHNYSITTQKDFAIIDLLAFYGMTPDAISSILSKMRCYFRKIILVDVDAWAGRYNKLLRIVADQIDYVWGFTNNWCLLNEPIFSNKCILFPCIGGLDHLDAMAKSPLNWNACEFNFTGSVQAYNLNRISWILGFIDRKLPIEINITDPTIDDGLDLSNSQHRYAQKLATTHASINLITRRDGARPPTGRSFEVISLHRLLVQESCPEFHSYFVKGDHFLEFSGIEELDMIIDFVRSHPKTAQRVCSQGFDFYKDRYSCNKLVEHIQTFL